MRFDGSVGEVFVHDGNVCGVLKDGRLQCMYAERDDAIPPKLVTRNSRVVTDEEPLDVAAGHAYVRKNGTVVTFYIGATREEPTNVQVHVLDEFELDAVEVVYGDGHYCARTKAGEVYCWGSNHRGQCGTGEIGEDVKTPQRVVAPGHRSPSDG